MRMCVSFRNPIRRNLQNSDPEYFFGSKQDREIAEANAELEEEEKRRLAAADAGNKSEQQQQPAAVAPPPGIRPAAGAQEEDPAVAADDSSSPMVNTDQVAKDLPGPIPAGKKLITLQPVNTKVRLQADTGDKLLQCKLIFLLVVTRVPDPELPFFARSRSRYTDRTAPATAL